MPRIALIEDDEAVNEALCAVLKRSGFEVDTFLDDRNFHISVKSFPDLYIIDRHLRGIDGLELCRDIKNQSIQIPIIMISASPDMGPLAYAAGANAFLEKPFSIKQLVGSIEDLLLHEPH